VVNELRLAAEDSILEGGREKVDVRADRDHHIGLRHGAVRARPAVAPHRSERERMAARKRIRVVLKARDGNSRVVGEALQGRQRALAEHAAAGEQHRSLRLRDRFSGAVELRLGASRQRTGPVRLGRDRLRLHLFQQYVARHVEMHRAERLGERMPERAPHRLLQLGRGWNRVRPFGDRPVERHLVDVLARVLLAQPELLGTADADHRHIPLIGRADSRQQIGDPGPFGRRHDGRLVERARKAIRHERRALLVPREDEADLGRGAQDIEDGQVHRPRDPEHVVDLLPAEAIDHCLRARDH
jgi:hypothetical protein